MATKIIVFGLGMVIVGGLFILHALLTEGTQIIASVLGGAVTMNGLVIVFLGSYYKSRRGLD